MASGDSDSSSGGADDKDNSGQITDDPLDGVGPDGDPTGAPFAADPKEDPNLGSASTSPTEDLALEDLFGRLDGLGLAGAKAETDPTGPYINAQSGPTSDQAGAAPGAGAEPSNWAAFEGDTGSSILLAFGGGSENGAPPPPSQTAGSAVPDQVPDAPQIIFLGYKEVNGSVVGEIWLINGVLMNVAPGSITDVPRTPPSFTPYFTPDKANPIITDFPVSALQAPSSEPPAPASRPVPASGSASPLPLSSDVPGPGSFGTPAPGPWESLANRAGGVMASIAGLFSPSATAQYLHPQFPSSLPPGMDHLARMNAGLAVDAQRDASARTRTGLAAAGAPYAVAELALAAPAVGAAAADASLAVAVRYPTVVSVGTDIANGVNGTLIPRAGLAAGGAAAGTAAAKGLGAAALSAAEELEPNIQPAPLVEAAETEAAVLFKARDEAAATARRVIDQGLADGTIKPGRAQQLFGTWLDALAKSKVRQAVADGKLPPTFVTSPTVTLSRGYLKPWVRAPDVWDKATGRAWDFMPATEAEFFKHDLRYLGEVAKGRADPTGTQIIEIFPLFHSGY